MASDVGLHSLPMKGARHMIWFMLHQHFFRLIPLKHIRLDISFSESSGGVCCLLMTGDSGGISTLTFVKESNCFQPNGVGKAI